MQLVPYEISVQLFTNEMFVQLFPHEIYSLTAVHFSRVLYPWLVHCGEETDVSILQGESGHQTHVHQSVSFTYKIKWCALYCNLVLIFFFVQQGPYFPVFTVIAMGPFYSKELI